MAKTCFKFINVLHPNEVKGFKALFTTRCNQNVECSSWSQSHGGGEKNNCGRRTVVGGLGVSPRGPPHPF